MKKQLYLAAIACILQAISSCQGQTGQGAKKATPGNSAPSKDQPAQKFTEGKDYSVFERVRIKDHKGFTEPVEAYSMLLPKGWNHQEEVIWIMPGQACAGNNGWLKATSPDGKTILQFFPNMIYSWSANEELNQWNRANGSSAYCHTAQPIDASQYFQAVFLQELGNPSVIKVEPNPAVASQLKSMSEKSKAEMMQYGAAGVETFPSALTAHVKWNDGTAGIVTLSSNITETLIYNQYNGSYSKSYSTIIMNKTVYRFPENEKQKATAQYAVIMGSLRSNTAYSDAVSGFWKQVRQQKNRVHWDKIKMMDEQTRQIGERAIAQGNQRLNDMDNQMRSWEAKQSSQDRMHTEFVKTIREVENFRDETGKYEMVAGYNQAWSRGDGSSFVLSDNPNFDPAFVFKDQAWKPMKKVN